MFNLRRLFFVVSVTLIPTPGTNATHFGLLTEDDLAFQQYDRNSGPALGSPIGAEEEWESYNRWLCFDSHQVQASCAEIEYNGIRTIPTLSAQTSRHTLEVDVPSEKEWDCRMVLQEWRQLLDGAKEVCIFAAWLQEIDQQSSLWVLNRFKTENGYWVEDLRESASANTAFEDDVE